MIKTHIFLAKSGELVEARKVTFTENADSVLSLPKNTIPGAPDHSYKIGISCSAHLSDGWVMFNPELAGGMTLFFNNEIEKYMEYLGEL